ncbi:glycerophosphodiester phosphodiesterase family protein [Paenisporosarcina sp.]|uniref:glycerophosphodiester phosphodiesterase family protein n=1 Tax=Paenisporosarcina sp. TaxID=1932001 RepID=UPI003C74341D
MKKILLLIFLLLTNGCTQPLSEPPPERTTLPKNDFLIIAHRGASAYAAEHTLASYEMAIQMGADYIEIDLQMTKDGKLVAMHDRVVTFDNAQQAVTDVTFDEIQLHSPEKAFERNYLDYTLPHYDDLRIVDLEEILLYFGDTVNYYIEIKSPKKYPGIEKELLKQLREHNLLDRTDIIPKVIIQSFDSQSLKDIFALEPSIPLIKLYTFEKEAHIPTEHLNELTQFASGVGVNSIAVSKEFIDLMHSKNLIVHPYTVNDAQTMRFLIDLGVNGFFTDRPDVANWVRSETNRLENR